MNVSWRQHFYAAVIIVGWCAPIALGNPIEGFTEPYRKVDLAPAEQGILMSVSVREGDPVRKDQLLAALDCEALLVSKQIAKLNMESHGRLDAAMAECNLRKSRFEKLQTLRAQGHASAEEVDRARADFDIATANVLSAQEQLAVDALEFKRTEALIERRMIRSPLDGVVSKIHHEEREFIIASAPTVLTVVELNPLRVIFSVPLSQSTSLKVGQVTPLTLTDSNEFVEGKIECVSPVADAESGTVRVKVLLDNTRGAHQCGVRCVLGRDNPELTTIVPEN
jgi:RND family efflux transporter MFP subunit